MAEEKKFLLNDRKVFIALPCYDHKVGVKLALSIAAFTRMTVDYGVNIHYGYVAGCSMVTKARNILVDEFLKTDCTHLMFIDADIGFEPISIFRLLAWAGDPKKGIVAGVPTSRNPPIDYLVTLDMEGNQATFNKDGLVKARRITTAFMMIRRDVFEKLKDMHPEWEYDDVKLEKHFYSYFDFKSTPGGYLGEDFLFCDRVREAGFEIWADPAIKLEHMGVIEHKCDYGNEALFPATKPVEDSQTKVFFKAA